MSIYLQRLFKTDELFTIEKNQDFIKVFFGANLLFDFSLTDEIETRRAIVQLKNIKASDYKLSNIFNISRATIKKWYIKYQNGGFNELDKIRTGPKKLTEEIKAYIIAKFYDLNFCRNYKKTICEGVLNHFNIKIHEKSVIKVLNDNKIDISSNRYNKKNKLKTVKSKSIKQRVENLGLLFIFPFLKKINLEKLFNKTNEIFTNMHYNSLSYIYSLILLLSSNMIQVEENIKKYSDKNLGVLIGKRNIPCVKNFRVNLKKIIEAVDINKFELSLCENYFKKSDSFKELYVDGHFMPYHGFIKIFKGYDPIRRMPYKGRTGYFINNCVGRPFFYILADGYKGFREYLKEIAENLKQITGKKDNEEIIMVFDRGGFDKELFKDISKFCNFICWKIGKINLPEMPVWEKIIIEHQGNQYDQIKKMELFACEQIKNNKEEKYYERNIWIKRGDKISPVHSNDKTRSLEELVKIITRRWGAQESVFKPLKVIGIDKISSYEKEEYPDNWLIEEDEVREVNNPEKLIIKEKIIEIKKEINSLKEKLGDYYVKNKESKKIFKIRNEIENRNKELTFQKNKLIKLPDKVDITKLIKSKNIMRLNGKKKEFMDLIKILSYNVQQDIVDFVRPVYKNQRDINVFVKEMFRKTGEIIIDNESIKVIFKKYSSKIKTKTLKYLCDEINKSEFEHPVLNKKVIFEVI